MREIKFRAWDKRNKRMECNATIEGGLAYFEDRNETRGKRVSNLIMQYTGLKDKNGNEIYEGDIVNALGVANMPYPEWVYNPGGEVKFGNGKYYIRRERPYICQDLSEYLERNLEVIGNIWENPELLKGQGE